ncbi:MAG TPA: hypothetical protein VFY69_00485 [Solirubrobacterales bacterium]|nr:hypothetical protein [Solirubrobacterales bacterium]
MRVAIALLGFAAVTLVTALIAHPQIFTGFAPYDDEGYMLVALDAFLDQGHLYDDVFSQYGPFYFEFWGAFFSLSGLSVDHDGGRTATMIAWVLAALLVGLGIWRTTGSALLGLGVQMVTFNGISSVSNEPMHPGGLICLLLGAVILISSLARGRSSPLTMGLLGAAVAALILIKVNVGVFALAAVALACAVSHPFLWRRRWPRLAIEAGFVAVPLLVMAAKVDEGWARHYAIHVAVAALAVVVVLRARRPGNREREELWWLLGGAAALSIAVCGAILASGTSPAGLFDGVIAQPLRQADSFWIPFLLDDRTYLFDLLALAGALAYWYLARGGDRAVSPALASAFSLLSILVGLEMALAVVGETALFDPTVFPGYPLGLIAFAWMALVPPPGGDGEDTAFARLLLPPLAVMQALHAFPVAGSQILWAAFLMIPVGALCIANGIRGLRRSLSGERERRAIGAIAVVAAAATMVALVNVELRQPLDTAREEYDVLAPLTLPGAEEVRLTHEEAGRYRRLAKTIDGYCASMLTLPGMGSFYEWARQEPPTGLNVTAWTVLFDDAQQRRVIAATRSTRNLCLLENPLLAAAWDRSPFEGPLVRYLRRGFRPLVTFGDYRLLRRERAAVSVR